MFKRARKALHRFFLLAVLLFLFVVGYKFVFEFMMMRRIIQNLKAESRIAEVLVTESSLDEYTRKYTTTIKFLEYDVKGRPLPAKYFTFKGNLIQFQTLVVRFGDKYIEEGHRLKGKSIYLFLKAFVLDGKNTQEFLITPAEETLVEEPLQPLKRIVAMYLGLFEKLHLKTGPLKEFCSTMGLLPASGPVQRFTVPAGYKVGDPPNYFEREVWTRFWKYALDPEARKRVGIKNAQVEAPGSVFIPGTIYTLMIEHDGGIRIDARPIPEILKTEQK